jgi:phospholipase/carboxylesterase
MLLLRPDALAGAMLLRAMVPLRDAPKVHLAGKPLLIISGQYDPIVPASNSAQLAGVLMNAGATVRTRALPQGHELSQPDLVTCRDWLKANFAKLAAVVP